MRLWRVEVTQAVYVLAKSQEDAERQAPSCARAESSDPDVWGREITELREVEKDWRDSLPYGGAETIEAWFTRKAKATP